VVRIHAQAGFSDARERSLTLEIWLSPPAQTLQRNAELVVMLKITRSRPIHTLLRMWRESREELKRLIIIAGACMDFGFGDDRDPEALDEYRLDPSRRHRLMILWRTAEPTDTAKLSCTFTSLARIYHVLQGILRGDCSRIINGPSQTKNRQINSAEPRPTAAPCD
jgi:hypothetical protein